MILPFSDLDERALKSVTGELVSACGGTGAAATLLRGPDGRPHSEARISGYCTPSDMSRFMPVRLVTKLEIACGLPLLSGWMAERLQRRDGGPSAPDLRLQDIVRVAREASELQMSIVDALEDGRVDAAERAVIRAEAQDLMRVAQSILQSVEQP